MKIKNALVFRFSNMSRRLAFLQKYVNIFRIHLEWQLSIFLEIFMYHIENRGFRICHIKNKVKIKLQFVNYPCIFILFDNDIAEIWIWSTYLVDYRNRKSFLNSCLPKNVSILDEWKKVWKNPETRNWFFWTIFAFKKW